MLGDGVLPKADRRRLVEDDAAQPWGQRGGDEHGQGVRGTSLFHQDRGQPGVGRAGLEQPSEDGRPQPWIEVVHVGLEDDGCVGRQHGPGLVGCRDGLAEHDAQDVRQLVELTPAGAHPGRGHPHRRQPAPPGDGCRQQRRAGRSAQLVGDVAGVHRRARIGQQLHHRRTGDGKQSMLAARHPLADCNRRRDCSRHSQSVQRGGASHHIGNGIEGADLVEVHLLRLDAVSSCLRTGQPGEDVERARLDWLGEVGVLDRRPDIAPGADDRRSLDAHVHLDGREAVPGDRLGCHLDAFYSDGIDRPLHRLQGSARINQCAEPHVAIAPARHWNHASRSMAATLVLAARTISSGGRGRQLAIRFASRSNARRSIVARKGPGTRQRRLCARCLINNGPPRPRRSSDARRRSRIGLHFRLSRATIDPRMPTASSRSGAAQSSGQASVDTLGNPRRRSAPVRGGDRIRGYAAAVSSGDLVGWVLAGCGVSPCCLRFSPTGGYAGCGATTRSCRAGTTSRSPSWR